MNKLLYIPGLIVLIGTYTILIYVFGYQPFMDIVWLILSILILSNAFSCKGKECLNHKLAIFMAITAIISIIALTKTMLPNAIEHYKNPLLQIAGNITSCQESDENAFILELQTEGGKTTPIKVSPEQKEKISHFCNESLDPYIRAKILKETVITGKDKYYVTAYTDRNNNIIASSPMYNSRNFKSPDDIIYIIMTMLIAVITGYLSFRFTPKEKVNNI